MATADRIQRLKDKLRAGNLSQVEAEQIANKIRELGGKVQLANFGYTGGVKNNPTSSTATPVPETISTGINSIKPNDPGSFVQPETELETYESEQQIKYQNPTIYSPTGSQTTEIDPVTGQPIVKQELDAGQQQILDQDTDLSQTGREAAQGYFSSGAVGSPFQADLSARTATGDLIGDRQRQEGELYDYLTRDIGQRETQGTQNLEQQMAVMGIPFSADPNSQYQQRMRALKDGFARERGDARAQALQFGGSEYERSFGIGEQLRSNQMNEQITERGQNINEASTFANFGPGLRAPNFQPYQGPQYELPGALEAWLALKGYALDRKAVNADINQSPPTINLGGGGSQQPQLPPNPFNQGPPPFA